MSPDRPDKRLGTTLGAEISKYLLFTEGCLLSGDSGAAVYLQTGHA